MLLRRHDAFEVLATSSNESVSSAAQQERQRMIEGVVVVVLVREKARVAANVSVLTPPLTFIVAISSDVLQIR
jgi:hypothetical protein